MKTACICDIKEFTVHDGEGIRVTVFLKGCPLRCRWCHNPETQEFFPELNLKTREICGENWTADRLAERLNSFRDVCELSGGGVTFSGGEPSCQADFLTELLPKLTDIHTILDTSGYCDAEKFLKLAAMFSKVYFDVKLADDEEHRKYTGESNRIILDNLMALSERAIPFHVRIPLIPQITDTEDNLNRIGRILEKLPNRPESIDLLPYNELAGAKYETFGKRFQLHKGIRNDMDIIRRFKKTAEEKGYWVHMEGEKRVK